MRSATALLLIGALLGVAPATAQAAPARHSVSHVALSSKRGGSSSSGGVSKSGGGVSKKKSRGGGHSSPSDDDGGASTGKKMPLWGAILFLLIVGGLLVWSAVKFVRKLRKLFSN